MGLHSVTCQAAVTFPAFTLASKHVLDLATSEGCMAELTLCNGKKHIRIAPYCRQPTSKALRYGNVLSRDLTVLPAHLHVYQQTA